LISERILNPVRKDILQISGEYAQTDPLIPR